MFVLVAPDGHIGTHGQVMRREALRHATRIAAIARDRDGGVPALDRAAHRRLTARRLAGNPEANVSDR